MCNMQEPKHLCNNMSTHHRSERLLEAVLQLWTNQIQQQQYLQTCYTITSWWLRRGYINTTGNLWWIQTREKLMPWQEISTQTPIIFPHQKERERKMKVVQVSKIKMKESKDAVLKFRPWNLYFSSLKSREHLGRVQREMQTRRQSQ